MRSRAVRCGQTMILRRCFGSQLPDAFLADLEAIYGSKLSTSIAVRDQHGHDESFYASQHPDVVVFPETTEQVWNTFESLRLVGEPPSVCSLF